MIGEKKNIFDLHFLTNFWQGGQGGNKKKNYLLLALLLLGILLMFSSSFFAHRSKRSVWNDEEGLGTQFLCQPEDNYGGELKKALEDILEHIDGISNVHVLITFSSSEEVTYAQSLEENKRETTEADREGGSRVIYEENKSSNYILLREAAGGEKPLRLMENMPRIKGVMVVAEGVQDAVLCLEVRRAIQSVLELPAHRIALLPHGRD